MKEMREETRALFFENYEEIKRAYQWEKSCIYPVCASLYTQKGKKAEIEFLKEERRRIKRDTGIFSCFRGNLRFPLAAMLTLEENPEETLQRLLMIHKQMREFNKPTMEIAAVSCILALKGKEFVIKEVEKNVKEWKKLLTYCIKTEVKFSQVPYFFLLSASDYNQQILRKHFTETFTILSPFFRNQLSAVSAALCLCFEDKEPAGKASDFIELFHHLKSFNVCSSSSTELAVISILSLSEMDHERIVQEVLRNREEFVRRNYFSMMDSGILQRNFYSMVLEAVSLDLCSQAENLQLLCMTELLAFVALPELIENMEQ